MNTLKLIVKELFWPAVFVLVLVLGMTACLSGKKAEAEKAVPTIPDLTRLKAIEVGHLNGDWSPIVYILEDTQTGEHYALARYNSSLTFTKLSK